MDNTIKKLAAQATAAVSAPVTVEEIYTNPRIRKSASIQGNRLMKTGLFPQSDREDREEELMTTLIGHVQKGEFDPSRSNIFTYAKSVFANTATDMIRRRNAAVNRGEPKPGEFCSLDEPIGEEDGDTRLQDVIPAEYDFDDAVETLETGCSRRQRLLDLVEQTVAAMPQDCQLVWKRRCEGRSDRSIARELGISHQWMAEKYDPKFRRAFEAAGIRELM